MSDAVINFYDTLSPEYRHNMGWDWARVMRSEGEILTAFLEQIIGRSGPHSLLDCSCGIGTQAIGIALKGYHVHATDLSPRSIDCARNEAKALGIVMDFSVADYRSLDTNIDEQYDVVLTCDNSIAHCLTDVALNDALTSMKKMIKPGGVLLISLRDYDALIEDRPRFNNEHVQDKSDGRRVVFQLWDWADDFRSYRNTQFLIRATESGYDLKSFETELRALRREEIISAAALAEFEDIRWHEPEQSGYYQPIVTARID